MSGPVLVRRLCLGGASDACSIFEPCPACREAFSAAVLAGAMEASGITDEEQVIAFLDAYARLRGELAAMVRQALEEDAKRARGATTEAPPPLPVQGPVEVAAPPKSEPRPAKLRSVFDEVKSRSEIPPPANDQTVEAVAVPEEKQKEEGTGT